ncbi:MAG TPA: hypothetical protein VM532_07780 [Burkholderiales bacterium]|nr:hypothetical protein [Burkholderiales bacterium]
MAYRVCEIVQILDDAWLINSTRRTKHYATHDSQPLKPGFYFVLWPATAKPPGYDGRARYLGPLSNKMHAEKLRTSAFALGLIASYETEPVCASVAPYC